MKQKIYEVLTKIFASYLLFSAVHFTPLLADEALETKLYNSCYAGSKVKDKGAETMCRCQAKKWASGKVQSPSNPSKSFVIKSTYTDKLISNWNTDIGIKNGANLKGDEAAMATIGMNIGMTCAMAMQAPVAK